MKIENTSLNGVFIVTPKRHGDARGYFEESWSAQAWTAGGLAPQAWVQDNHSRSDVAGTLRGLHYQAPPHGQAKLVRCTAGEVWDVAVDVRGGSPSYGHWVGVTLSARNGCQLFVPEGFLHGFVTRAPGSEIAYKCSAPYNAQADGAVLWDSCGIDWGLDTPPALSPKDAAAPPLAAFDSPFIYGGAP